MNFFKLSVFALLITLMSCKTVTSDQLIKNIDEIKSSSNLDELDLQQVFENIETFTSRNEKDSLTPIFSLFKDSYLSPLVLIQNKIEALKGENDLDQAKVNELITSIDQFVVDNKDDEKTAGFLELKAKYLTALGENTKALAVYQDIYEHYDTYKNHSDALFMIAFIYENNLNDKANAELNYQKYLNEFPNGDFAKDAQFSLDNMNKTPEELMEMFRKMNEAKSNPE